jgi:hypothetical protein
MLNLLRAARGRPNITPTLRPIPTKVRLRQRNFLNALRACSTTSKGRLVCRPVEHPTKSTVTIMPVGIALVKFVRRANNFAV